MAKRTAKKKPAKKMPAKKQAKMKKLRTQLDAVLKGLKGVRGTEATRMRKTITKFKADSECGLTLFGF
jgi:hypothetical protein